MQLHRIISLPFAADPNWSGTQVEPPDSVIATSLGGTRIGGGMAGGRIYWTIIPYNGNTTDSQPVDGAGTNFDARLVYTINAEHTGSGTRPIVVGRKSPGEIEAALIPIAREIVEFVPQQGGNATIQMLSLVPVGAATHFWIYWDYEKREGV